MEWYHGTVTEDLAVRNNKDMFEFDRLPSPNSWSSWGKLVGTSNTPKKISVPGVEECLLSDTMFPGVVEKQSSPSLCQGSRHSTRQQSVHPREHSDIQRNDDDLSIANDADDIFFRSLFEADNGIIDEALRSTNFTQISSKDDLKPAVDLAGERNHIQDCTNMFENASHFPPAKEPKFEMCVSEEHSNEEDMSLEESVLLDLQRSTLQLAKKTRMCFRDSFYRLAENSRHQADCFKNEKENLENCKPTTDGGPFRLQESNAKIPDIYAIDTTVATVLFNTMNYCNLYATPISDLDPEPQGEYQGNSNLFQPSSSVSCICTVPGGDAEVPTLGLKQNKIEHLKASGKRKCSA